MEINCKSVYLLLKKIGVPTDLKGYKYITEALLIIHENGEDAGLKMTTWLYPELAKKFSATPARIERAIRHAVVRTFDRLKYDIAQDVFGNWDGAKSQPANKQFLTALLKYLKYKNNLEESI